MTRILRRGGITLFAVASVVAALLLAPGEAQAQWKWRDASGRIQLSDLPPPASVPEKDILQRPGAPRNAAPVATAPASAAAPATAGASTPRTPSPLQAELDRRKKADEQERSAQGKAEEERRSAQRADNCSRAREAVATMDSGQRISRINSKGEREFLDDRQRAAEAQRARDIMASDCR